MSIQFRTALVPAALLAASLMASRAMAQLVPPAPAAAAPSEPYVPKATPAVPVNPAPAARPANPASAEPAPKTAALPDVPMVDIIKRDDKGEEFISTPKPFDDLVVDALPVSADTAGKIAAVRKERQALMDRSITKNAGSALDLYAFMQKVDDVKDMGEFVGQQANILPLYLVPQLVDMLGTTGANVLSPEEYEAAKRAVSAYKKKYGEWSVQQVNSDRQKGMFKSTKAAVMLYTIESVGETQRMLAQVCDDWATIKKAKEVGEPSDPAKLASAEAAMAKAKTPKEKADAAAEAMRSFPQTAWSAILTQVSAPLPPTRLVPDSIVGKQPGQTQPVRAVPSGPPPGMAKPAPTKGP